MITDWAKIALLNGLKQGLESGTSLPRLEVYDDQGTLLAVVELDKSFEVIDGVLVLDSVGSDAVLADGTATTAKLFNGEGVQYMTLDVGVQVVLDTSQVRQGGNFNINRIEFSIA